MKESNITDAALFDMGFKLGATDETFRLDGEGGKDWYYIQIELNQEGDVRYRVYAEEFPLCGQWQLLDRAIIHNNRQLRELIDQLFDRVYEENQSLIARSMPLQYIDDRG